MTTLKSRFFSLLLRGIVAIAVVGGTAIPSASATAKVAMTVAQMNQAHDIAVAIHDAVLEALSEMDVGLRADNETVQKLVAAIIERELAKADNPLVANAAIGDARTFLGAVEGGSGFTLPDMNMTAFQNSGIQAAFDAKQPTVIAAAIVYVTKTSGTAPINQDRDNAILDVLTNAGTSDSRIILSGLGTARLSLANEGIKIPAIDNRMTFILSTQNGGNSQILENTDTGSILDPYGQRQPQPSTSPIPIYVG